MHIGYKLGFSTLNVPVFTPGDVILNIKKNNTKISNILCCWQVLKLSTASVSGSMDTGCVINLLGVDALKISQMVRASHEIITLPIYLALAAFFLYINLYTVRRNSIAPFASLIGMAVMVTLVPLTTFFVAWKTKRLQVCACDSQTYVELLLMSYCALKVGLILQNVVKFTPQAETCDNLSVKKSRLFAFLFLDCAFSHHKLPSAMCDLVTDNGVSVMRDFLVNSATGTKLVLRSSCYGRSCYRYIDHAPD